MSGKVINVGFIGNPNCGKTTLFNAYTGANLKVANWPGVTVEKKEGRTTYKGQEFKLIDLPGIYSLTSYTMEEKVSRECIMSDEVDVIVDVLLYDGGEGVPRVHHERRGGCDRGCGGCVLPGAEPVPDAAAH